MAGLYSLLVILKQCIAIVLKFHLHAPLVTGRNTVSEMHDSLV